MILKEFTTDDIRSNRPCYDPNKYLPEGWKGTALNLAKIEAIPFTDILWVLKHDNRIPDNVFYRFAAWCAAEALFIPDKRKVDQRSWNAVKAVIDFIDGKITKEEVKCAADAAYYVDTNYADAAAYAAAYVLCSTYDATHVAAYAVDAIINTCAYGEYDATYATANAAQRKKFISMLKGESSFTMSDFLNMG